MSDFDIPRQQTDAVLEAQLDRASEVAFQQAWAASTRRKGSVMVNAALALPGIISDISTRLPEGGRPENRPDKISNAQIKQFPPLSDR